MQFTCTHCGLSSEDGNLWCQRTECAAGQITGILRRGEQLGEMEIGNLLRFMRTAAVYEAIRGNKKVLVKVAHIDTQSDLKTDKGFARYIKNEAHWLDELRKKGQSHKGLPTLLPPYERGTLDDTPYGRVGYRDHLRYYLVFEYVRGQFLRDLLNDNPQPRHEFAAWFTIQLADILAMLGDEQVLGLRHLALSPDVVMVRTDAQGYYRPVLFDFGIAAQPVPERVGSTDVFYNSTGYFGWLSRYVHPAYTAPELMRGRNSSATDVYGLGLILYEMLAGRPAFEYATRTEQLIRAAVRDGYRRPINRDDVPMSVVQAVDIALRPEPMSRQSDMRVFAQHLQQVYGAVPREEPPKRRWMSDRMQNMMLAAALIIILFLIGLAVASQINL